MEEAEKITIIEGPPPTFELATEPWLMGVAEGPYPTQIALCKLRTHNGPALVERCYRAWRDQQTIKLEFRTEDGLTQQAPIISARWMEMQEGDVLLLWVRLDDDEVEIELDFDLGDLDDPENPDDPVDFSGDDDFGLTL
jgi:hypothetical protein